MKKRMFAVFAVMGILCSGLSACVPGQQQEDTTTAPVQTTQTQPEETTQPKSPLEQIRTQSFTDIAADSADYDVACYMRHYDIMDVTDGAFLPYAPVIRADAAETFCRLTGKNLQQELAEQNANVTRAQLAVMLYETAKYLGYDTQVSGTELAYIDAQQVAAEKKEALLWASEKGLLRSFAGQRFLPDIAVSRLQLAQAMVALKAMDPEDVVAQEIMTAMPVRNSESAAVNNHDAIQAVVDAVAQKYSADGLQVAVVENGVVTDTYAYGWATKNTDPMTADHKLRVASISKVVVGITAQLLREEGIIDLDGDISNYWGVTVKNPRHPNTPITIRSLLTHTSSIVIAGDDVSRAYKSVKAKLQGGYYSGGVPGDIASWGYNNYAFGVLGMTLELAANRITDDILKDRLYTAMDIDGAFGSGDIQNTDMLATLYQADGTVARTVAKQKGLHSSDKPGAKGSFFAGGLTISAYDLAKLTALLAGDGRYEGVQLLQPESVGEMETYIEQPTPDGSYQAHPMRYWPDLYGRKGIFFHTGSAYGVFNAMTYDPVTGDGVVVLTTGASGAKDAYGIYKVCAEINAEIYKTIA